MSNETSKDAKAIESAEKQGGVAQGAGIKERKKALESVYSIDELATNARKIFGTRQECVIAALKAADKSECTVSEAKKIVEKFLRREVR